MRDDRLRSRMEIGWPDSRRKFSVSLQEAHIENSVYCCGIDHVLPHTTSLPADCGIESLSWAGTLAVCLASGGRWRADRGR